MVLTVVEVVEVDGVVDDVGPACMGTIVEGAIGTVSPVVPLGGVATPVMGGLPTGTGTVCVRTKAEALPAERAPMPVAKATATTIPLTDAPTDQDLNRVVEKRRTL